MVETAHTYSVIVDIMIMSMLSFVGIICSAAAIAMYVFRKMPGVVIE